MKALKVVIACVILAAAMTAPLLIKHRAEKILCAKTELLHRQANLIAELAMEDLRMSNLVANANSSQSLSDAQLTELLKLRNEISQLRQSTREREQLQREQQRICDAIHDLETGKESNAENPTGLLADEMELRQARLAKLKKWLEEMPEEKIPELQFLSEQGWVRSADRLRATDEEYRGWMGAQRGNAQMRFANMAFKALKQYAEANNDQFPTDLSQLKPYFESPIDDAILQRYEIVAAKSLTKLLAETGGEWVITQKAPVNEKWDSRYAIGLTGYRGTVEEGRWGPPH